MTVKEVIALAAENLGRDDLSAEIAAMSGEAEGEVKSLLRCYNLVENEVALDYCPLKKTEQFALVSGSLFFTRFSSAPVDVYKVEDAAGRDVKFELYPTHLYCRELDSAKVNVTYSYTPKEKKLSGESEFSGRVSARLLALGVASEFCLSCGQYQEAAIWEKRFRDALRAAQLLRRKLCVRSRRWV